MRFLRNQIMNDLLLYEISEVQKEYKDLLVNLRDKLTQNNSAPILDEIEVFWHKHRRLVRNAIRYLSKPYQTFVFTAAVILDIDDYEHYPFLCLGNCHIWDDPIYAYICMKEKSPNEAFNKAFEEQILKTIEDNIRIISELNNYILILPIRMISEIDTYERIRISEKLFFSLFKKPPTSIDEYRKSYSTIDDLDKGLADEVKDRIILSEDDIESNTFIERFNECKSVSQLPIKDNSTDAEVFWMHVFGYISQAVDIISNAVTYKFVPYIRYNVAFKYILILYNSFEKIPENQYWLNRVIVAHILHEVFDKEKCVNYNIKDYVKKINESNFETQLFQAIEDNKVFTENQHPQLLVDVIKKVLKESLFLD